MVPSLFHLRYCAGPLRGQWCRRSRASLDCVMSLEQELEKDFGLIPDLVHYHAREAPERIALIDEARQVTYGEFDALCDRVAATLQRDGLAPQSAVAVCALSSIEYASLFLGALRAGIAVSPLAPSSTPESLAVMVAHCGSP